MTLAELSSDLVWAAATVLTVALVAFTVDLARLTGRVPAREAEREPVPEPVGGPRPGTPQPGMSGTGASGPGPSGSAGPDLSAGREGPVSRRAANIGVSVSWLGAVLLLAAIVARGFAAGRTPWANMYEFTLVGAFMVGAVFLVVNLRRDVRFLGAFITGMVVLFLVLAQNMFYVAATGVPPALQKYWLVIHVGVAIVATGIFTVAFCTSCLQLLRDSREHGNPYLGTRMWQWLDATPGAGQLEALSFRLNAMAFVLWTFTIIGGAIWAEDAWGRYWGWDPKEVWSFVIWVVYAAYLHARTTRGWGGRRAAYFVLLGYACVLFNFTGVNLIFNGKHSYSGL